MPSLLSVIAGAIALYYLRKIANSTQQKQVQAFDNYGNRIVIDRRNDGNYFIASNTNYYWR